MQSCSQHLEHSPSKRCTHPAQSGTHGRWGQRRALCVAGLSSCGSDTYSIDSLRGQEQPGDTHPAETQEQRGLLGSHHLVTPAPWLGLEFHCSMSLTYHDASPVETGTLQDFFSSLGRNCWCVGESLSKGRDNQTAQELP